MTYRKLSELRKLPNNPRVIRNHDFEKLCKSIADNPDYFEARPLVLSDRTGELVIIAGNQRFEASKHLKLEKVPTFLIENLTKERENEIIIRDNISNGEWNFEELANNWDSSDLEEWGLYVPQEEEEIEEEERPAKQEDTGIIAITLTDDEQELWAECKSKLKIKTDKTAFLKLITNFLTPQE